MFENKTSDTLELLVPDTAVFGEVLINEVLFDPILGGSDYLEIVNNSNSSFDIYNYLIADYDNGISNYKKIDQHYIQRPGELALLTEDSSQLINDYFINYSPIFLPIN